MNHVKSTAALPPASMMMLYVSALEASGCPYHLGVKVYSTLEKEQVNVKPLIQTESLVRQRAKMALNHG
jgi:hypothetical protein